MGLDMEKLEKSNFIYRISPGSDLSKYNFALEKLLNNVEIERNDNGYFVLELHRGNLWEIYPDSKNSKINSANIIEMKDARKIWEDPLNGYAHFKIQGILFPEDYYIRFQNKENSESLLDFLIKSPQNL